MPCPYKKTRTHEDFVWPRLVALTEKPAQPPLRTGERIFQLEPDRRVCREQTHDGFTRLPERERYGGIETKRDGTLMSRRTAMLANEDKVNKYYVCDRLQSTYQRDFGIDEFSYDELINEAFGKGSGKRGDKKRRAYVDPFEFKVRIDTRNVII